MRHGNLQVRRRCPPIEQREIRHERRLQLNCAATRDARAQSEALRETIYQEQRAEGCLLPLRLRGRRLASAFALL